MTATVRKTSIPCRNKAHSICTGTVAKGPFANFKCQCRCHLAKQSGRGRRK